MRTILLSLFAALFFCACASTKPEEPMKDVIDRVMKVAEQQTVAMADSLLPQEGRLPRTLDPKTGKLLTSDSRWWCSGFFPGTLWYLYEYDKSEKIKALAEEFTDRVEQEKYTTSNHDVGFMLYCSFGNELRLTGDTACNDVLLTGSKSLITRYNPTIGLIRSWDFKKDVWQYPVIIDNMMNLEMLMWAFKYSGDSTFYKIAVSHTDKTLKNHYRSDYSCYHVVSYDTITGAPEKKQTQQGASDESIWARGQAWGLYGFTMMYRETGKKEYLEQAQHIAKLMIHHPNMPDDMIPYWDYLAPNIPNEERDASTAAIMASGLIELSDYVHDELLAQEYMDVAEKQLRVLASPEYLAEPGTNGNFLLKHNVGSKPQDSEVDVPLTYADYYFLEALNRYNQKLK
ncbi:glycoside hydrolase family 88 protein [Mangrovibacterium diazotrophicum]|uniref:Glycosyl hydrolase family 88 n=1 Tax=Mangrovibacterium diazotrophicum TaxID=1261403 RepID=A0A419VYI6_9BACT|nr:glycoside hydrolase family 88 protein [Mangrovibacterium diazotrophicum]RKD88291.1 glycosyl hydrolase family 88 [Mangrovibacterium diazotrophicum]